MSQLSEAKRRLREHSEHYLLQDSVRRLGKGVPGTVKPYADRRAALAAALRAALPARAVVVQAAGDGQAADDREGLDAAAARALRALEAAAKDA